MKTPSDQREDLLQDIEDVLTSFSESGRRILAKQIIHDAAFYGTKTQTPVLSREEAVGIIHESLEKFYGDLKVREEFEQFHLN